MAWKCPECGSLNNNSIISCTCGYEKGTITAPRLELLQTTSAEEGEQRNYMQTIRLPIKKIMLNAFLIPLQNHVVYLRALTIPTAVLTLISVLFWLYMSYLASYLLQFPTTTVPATSINYVSITSENSHLCLPFVLYLVFYSVFFILFATTVHRIVLMGHGSVPRYGIWKWTQREMRFLGWLIAVVIIYIVVYFISSIVIGLPIVAIFVAPLAKASGIEGEIQMPWLAYILTVPATYISARLSLLFPATAVDRRPDLRWTWNMTKNNGWRMSIIVGALPWFLSFLKDTLLPGGATVYEHSQVTLIGYALILPIEITALSLSYKELTDFNDKE